MKDNRGLMMKRESTDRVLSNGRFAIVFGALCASAALALVCPTAGAGSISVIPEAAFSGETGMRIVLDDGRVTYVQDDTPEALSAYQARFYVRFDDLALPSLSELDIFNGLDGMGDPVFRVTARQMAGATTLIAAIRFNNGGFASPPAGVVPAVTTGWHRVEVAWVAGAGTGSLTLSVDGVSTIFDTVTNDLTAIESVRLGGVSGAPSGTTGSFDMDDFVSRNSATPIGEKPTSNGISDLMVNLGVTSASVDLFAAFDDAETADANLVFAVVNVSDAQIVTETAVVGATGMLDLTIGTEAAGTSAVTVRATDEAGLSVETTFSVLVNAPPMSTGIDDVLVPQNAPNSAISLFDVFEDDATADGDLVLAIDEFSNAGLFAAAFIEDGTGILVFNYLDTAFGVSGVTVSATDEGGLKTSATFNVTVDGAPTATAIGTVVVNQGTTLYSLDLTDYFDDPEEGAAGLAYTFMNSNTAVVTSIALDPNTLQLLFALASGATGSSDITVTGTDDLDQAAEATFSIVLNGPPTTTGLSNVSVNANGANTVIDLFAAFADTEDEDADLTYTVSANTSPGLFDATTVDGTAGTLTLDYANNASGMATLTMRATDTNGLFVEASFEVMINGGPMSTGIDGVTVNVNSEPTVVNLFAAFSDEEDPDMDLVYMVPANSNVALFDAVTVDGTAGTLTLNYAMDTTGSANITVRATDMGGLFTEAIFTVVVNGAPASNGIGNVTVNIGGDPSVVSLFDAFDDVEDADGDLIFAVTANSNAALFDATTVDGIAGTLTLDFAAGTTGTAMLTVRATDSGGLTTDASFTVLVNGSPTTTGLDDVSVSVDAEDTVIDLTAAFADAESGAGGLSYAVAANTNEALFAGASIAAGMLTLDYAAGATGEAMITIRATDNGGLFVESTFMVTVKKGGIFSCAADGAGTAPAGGARGDLLLLLAAGSVLIGLRRYGVSSGRRHTT